MKRDQLLTVYVFSNETVGVIFKIEPEAFRILDQSGAVRTLRPSQIGNKLDTRMSVATDKDNYELRAGDMVRESAIGVRDISIRFHDNCAILIQGRFIYRIVNHEPAESCMYGVPCSPSCIIEILSRMEVSLLRKLDPSVQSLLGQSAASFPVT